MGNSEYLNLIKEILDLKLRLIKITEALEILQSSKLNPLYITAAVSFATGIIVWYLTWLKDSYLFKRTEAKDNSLRKYQKTIDEGKELRRISGKLLGLHHSLRIDIHQMNEAAINGYYFFRRFSNENVPVFNSEYLRFEKLRIDIEERVKVTFNEYVSLVGEHCFICEKSATIPLLNTFIGNSFVYGFNSVLDDDTNLNENKRLELIKDLTSHLFNTFNTPSITIVNLVKTEGLEKINSV